MNVNVGTTDKTVRVIVGIFILALGYYYRNWWGLIGLLPLGTGLFGWCVLYSLSGVSTCKTKDRPAKS